MAKRYIKQNTFFENKSFKEINKSFELDFFNEHLIAKRAWISWGRVKSKCWSRLLHFHVAMHVAGQGLSVKQEVLSHDVQSQAGAPVGHGLVVPSSALLLLMLRDRFSREESQLVCRNVQILQQRCSTPGLEGHGLISLLSYTLTVQSKSHCPEHQPTGTWPEPPRVTKSFFTGKNSDGIQQKLVTLQGHGWHLKSVARYTVVWV